MSNKEFQDSHAGDVKFAISIADSATSLFWYPRELTFDELKQELSRHSPRSNKNGPAFVPASIHGKRRRKTSILSIGWLVFDIDAGLTFEEVRDRIKVRGYAGAVYTSFSHLKTTTNIRLSHYQDWARKNGASDKADEASVDEYLQGKGLGHLSNVKVGNELVETEEGACIRLEHDPVHKVRIVLPLKAPFVVAENGGTDGASALWKRYYKSIGRALGLPFDPACSDLTRTFYFPSHPIGARADQYDSVFLEGEFLDYRDFELLEDEAPVRTKTPAGAERPNQNRELVMFAARYGNTFRIADALEARGKAPILGRRARGGLFIECPFEEGHSGPAPQRTFVENGDGQKGFAIHCSGAHCQEGSTGRDRLEFLARILDLGWLDRADLENPVFGGGPLFAEGKKKFVWEAEEPIRQAKHCADVLVKANDAEPRMFSMGGCIHLIEFDRKDGRGRSVPMEREMLRREIEEQTTWVRLKDDDERTRYISAPRAICDHVMQLIEPRLPLLERIVHAPFFDAEGNLVAKPGYHEVSRTYYAPPRDLEFSVPDRPTEEDLQRSIELLREPFVDFPFRDWNGADSGEASFAHVMAMLLHPFVRLMISGPTPAYLIQKPTPGTGAGLLTDVVSLIAFGIPAKMEVGKTDGDEWRKSITASLLGGASMIVFDNIHSELKDQSIAAAITAETWSDRLLGKSQKVELPNNALWVFTGNNVTFSSEIARRLVMVRLDAGLVDPTQERSYRHPDLKRWVKRSRATFVSAILTIIQAWVAAGRPSAKKSQRLASFEDWSALMGDILSFAGIEGFLGDRETIKSGISDEADAVQQFIQYMFQSFGSQPTRVGRLNWDDKSRSGNVQAEFLEEAAAQSLAELVLDHADSLTFWWLSEPKEKWGNRIGRELSQHIDRIFEVETASGIAQVKLRKKRKESGILYFLELVKPSVPNPVVVKSSDDDGEAPGLNEYVRRDPVACPGPAGETSERTASPASQTVH